MANINSDSITIAPYVTIRLSGTGGQGLILCGRLLAEAAAIYEGCDVVQTNSYGPEARGGASRSEVVVGKGDIDILHAPVVDALICLSQKACDSYYGDLRRGGLLITDSTLVEVVPTARAIEVPVTKLAESLGNKMVTNVVALGVLCSITQIVSRRSLEQAVSARVPKALREINLRAVEQGYVAASKALDAKSEKARRELPKFKF